MKLVFPETCVDLEDEVFAALALASKGLFRIPGTQVSAYPADSNNILKQVIETGVRGLLLRTPSVVKVDGVTTESDKIMGTEQIKQIPMSDVQQIPVSVNVSQVSKSESMNKVQSGITQVAQGTPEDERRKKALAFMGNAYGLRNRSAKNK